jgi:cation:H+ antiporter
MTGLGLLALAGVLLSLGADLFTDHATDFAHRWHVHPVAIGVLLAGAEPEELVTAIAATRHHHPAIAAGDIIGANVTMLTLVVGIASVLGVLRLSGVRVYFAVATAASLVAAICVSDGSVSATEGVILSSGYVALVVFVLRRDRAPADADADPRSDAGGGLLALFGLVLVVAGGALAVRGAEGVTERFDLGDTAVGLTLVALATSGELFALLWASRRHGMSELAVAAIAGSVAANATATLGVTALVANPLRTGDVRPSAALAAATAGVLLVAASSHRWPLRLGGVVLVGVYVCYVVAALR